MIGKRKLERRLSRLKSFTFLMALALSISACSTLIESDRTLNTAAVCGTTNIAQNKPSLSSSDETNTLVSSKAFDGDAGTRWSSAFTDQQWVQIDLGSVQPICGVTLQWEAAYARAFRLEVSNDGNTWTPVYSTTSGTGGTQEVTLTANTSGHWVRMLGTQRATPYGYSLYEFKVYAGGAGGGLVCFFENINYGGASFCADADSSWVGTTRNDRISSVKVQSGYQVQLFGDISYGGASKTLTGDTASLPDFNDQASSFKLGKTGDGKVVGTYYATFAGSVPRLKDIDPNYNLIYLFAATQAGREPTGTLTFAAPPDGNGAWTNWAADMQAVRKQGRKVILSAGGANQAIRFTDRGDSAFAGRRGNPVPLYAGAARSPVRHVVFVAKENRTYDEMDFNTFEADADPNTPELIWVAKELKRRYPGFLITAPPAPWSRRDQKFCKDMLDAGALDYCAPQYYDGPDLSSPAYLLENITLWMDLLGPQHVVVGFGVNNELNNYWAVGSAVDTFKKLEARYPNVRGVFDWRLDWDARDGYPFARQ
ncbi:MAG: CBM32, partial [uncultured Truepera sp.]